MSQSIEVAKQQYARDLAAYTREKWLAARSSVDRQRAKAEANGSPSSSHSRRASPETESSHSRAHRGRASPPTKTHKSSEDSIDKDEKGDLPATDDVRIKDYAQVRRN